MVEEKAPPVSALASASMLRIAGTWQSMGQVNQAIGVYFRILQQHPGTPEAMEARERLLALAATFERGARFHLAMDLYQKIERACR